MRPNRMHYEGTTRATAELIEGAIKPILQLMPRLHAMVIGPGLGRDPFAMDCVERVIEEARKSKLPLVIDGVCFFFFLQMYYCLYCFFLNNRMGYIWSHKSRTWRRGTSMPFSRPTSMSSSASATNWYFTFCKWNDYFYFF